MKLVTENVISEERKRESSESRDSQSVRHCKVVFFLRDTYSKEDGEFHLYSEMEVGLVILGLIGAVKQ